MWVLRKVNGETTKYLISEKKSYTVGRQNCDFIFHGDLSISRKHCTLHLAKKNECPFEVNTSTGVWLVDEHSKYGTFIRNNNAWVKITPSQDYKLSHGCIIKFGLMENIWSLEYKPLVVCTSGIQTSQKNYIECALKPVDGEVRNSWCKGCSLVIVNDITLTVKVVLALVLGVPIVTPNYVEKVVESIKNQTSLPKYEDHRPEIKESVLDASLVSLDVNHNRKELFKGKKFIIPTKKQLEILKEVITSAGGKAELLSLSSSWARFAEDNTILIQSPLNDSAVPDSLTKSVKEIAMYLQSKHNKRVIPESEIAQAVAYSSTEKYCNPKSSCFSLRRVQKKQPQGDVLVEETPDITEEKIPDSCFVPNSVTINSQSQSEEIFEPHCSKILSDRALMNPPSERKRAHSPVQLGEYEMKKPRKSGKHAQDVNPALKSSVVKEKQPKETEKKSKSGTVNSSKSPDITNYFKKLNKPVGKIQEVKSDPSDFWNYENCMLKRKSSTESNAGGETFRKKAKLPDKNQNLCEPEIDTPREAAQVVQAKSSAPSPVVRRVVEEERDFTEYFGKDNDDIHAKINALDSTIFSMTLISSVYLKADGSLIEPPSVPVNVKKFRKQRVQSIAAVDPVEHANEDLSDGEWIEPHPREISVGDKNW